MGTPAEGLHVLEARAADPEDPLFVASRLDAVIRYPDIYKGLVEERGFSPAEAVERLTAWTARHDRKVRLRSVAIWLIFAGSVLISRFALAWQPPWWAVVAAAAVGVLATAVARVLP